MSYCRWSECDVYAYDSCEGGVRFWVAGNDSFNRLCGTYNEAYQYAKELRDKHGFDVPSHAIDALREDAIEEAKQHLGPDSAVADMLADIAKLREQLEYALQTSRARLETIDRLKAENAKLRELAAQTLQIIKHVNVVMAVDWSKYSAVMSMARELGIEVS